MTPFDCDVIVVGGGPAGSTVAMGLAKLGHRVTVLSAARRYDSIEGIAPRAIHWLQRSGFDCALRTIGAPAHREVFWNGTHSHANTEHLVARVELDRALIADLESAHVATRRTRMQRVVEASEHGVSVLADSTTMRARIIVDARGRTANRAPASNRRPGMGVLRGPPTLSVSQSWSGPATDAASAVFAFEDGWGWLARCADGTRVTQLTVAADAPDLPRRRTLATWLLDRSHASPVTSAWIQDCVPKRAAAARASTAVFRTPWQPRENVLRVGDAAMAVDPLSGNGIFQSLSSASVAPSVVNTILRRPDSSSLALAFYEERCRHLFERFSRIGREFYQAEARWTTQSFWRTRSAWPDDEPAHDRRDPTIRTIERRPVVDNGFICEREVVVTDDQPLGVWRVADVEVAPLVRELQAMPDAARLTRLEHIRDPTLRAWLIRIGVVPA